MSDAVTEGRSVTARAPAKVNLELVVGPRRDDGYHDLATVFHAVGLHDDVTLTPADEWSVTTTGPYAGLVPDGEDNLALRAARLLAAEHGVTGAARIEIAKDIPVAAGLAGGSADAAAALVAADHLWGLGLDRADLDDLAQRLGSDVNFALAGGTALGSGRGERVVPALARGSYHWVLVTSDEGLSTPAVFAECDRLREGHDVPPPEPTPAMMAALRAADPEALGLALSNDLEEAAFSLRPDLRRVVEAGTEFGALGGLVSGSGPTIAFLVAGAEAAIDLAVALTASGTATHVHRVVGPAPGTHLVTDPTHPSTSGGPGLPSVTNLYGKDDTDR